MRFALLEETTLQVRPVPLSLTIKRGAVGPTRRILPRARRAPDATSEKTGGPYANLRPSRSIFRIPSGGHPVRWIIFPQLRCRHHHFAAPPEAGRRPFVGLLREWPGASRVTGFVLGVENLRPVDPNGELLRAPDEARWRMAVDLVKLKRHCGAPGSSQARIYEGQGAEAEDGR